MESNEYDDEEDELGEKLELGDNFLSCEIYYYISNDDDEVNEEKLKRGDIFPSLVQRVEIWWVGGNALIAPIFGANLWPH